MFDAAFRCRFLYQNMLRQAACHVKEAPSQARISLRYLGILQSGLFTGAGVKKKLDPMLQHPRQLTSLWPLMRVCIVTRRDLINAASKYAAMSKQILRIVILHIMCLCRRNGQVGATQHLSEHLAFEESRTHSLVSWIQTLRHHEA